MKNFEWLWPHLVREFKHIFSVFKQHYTYFHIFFHPYVFSKKLKIPSSLLFGSVLIWVVTWNPCMKYPPKKTMYIVWTWDPKVSVIGLNFEWERISKLASYPLIRFYPLSLLLLTNLSRNHMCLWRWYYVYMEYIKFSNPKLSYTPIWFETQ